jgi:phosphopantetheinyl transferase (holo-ACP synthase)
LPVGNDVVDLGDPENQPEAIHPRWDSRVFTPQELDTLAAAPSLHRTRWMLWAAKESAFKAAMKMDPGLAFFPRAFAVELLDDASARVVHEVGRFQVRLDVTVEYAHAVATPEGSPQASSRVRRLQDGGSPSRQVREMARLAIGSSMDVEPSDIEVSVAGVPVVSQGGVALALDLSLSHHGRFMGCAWLRSEYPAGVW